MKERTPRSTNASPPPLEREAKEGGRAEDSLRRTDMELPDGRYLLVYSRTRRSELA